MPDPSCVPIEAFPSRILRPRASRLRETDTLHPKARCCLHCFGWTFDPKTFRRRTVSIQESKAFHSCRYLFRDHLLPPGENVLSWLLGGDERGTTQARKRSRFPDEMCLVRRMFFIAFSTHRGIPFTFSWVDESISLQ